MLQFILREKKIKRNLDTKNARVEWWIRKKSLQKPIKQSPLGEKERREKKKRQNEWKEEEKNDKQ